MKKLLLTSLLLANSIILPAYAKESSEQSLDQMVAVVNEDMITRSELDRAMIAAKAQISQSGSSSMPSEKTLEKQVLQQLINKKLQLQVATQAGIKISNGELDEAISRIASQNNISVDQLYDHIKQSGMTAENYRLEIREQIALQKLQQHEIGGKVSVTPEEVTAFMKSNSFKENSTNEYKLQDILIPTSDMPSPAEIAAAKTRAESIMQKLRNGADFTTLAKSESRGETALQGGDLGWRKLPEIPSAFTDYMSGMKKHDIAGPIQTPNGFHILFLTDLRKLDGANRTLADRKTIESMLLQQKFETAIQNYVSKLRSQAFIMASN
ncbi:MAG TPA: peptidylprolyl isomerase [Gammaproteobacteria bacterium]|jgi:peptidyl-prolyl cis-trans isomerase SurA|nr:peptidylprolyl isomerase [Gammaproteobacteria bacterium]